MAPPGQRAYRFGEFTLVPADHQLVRDGREIPLRPKAFETLLHLVGHHGHVVSKRELLDQVWAGTHVTEAVLTHCIAEIRRALSDDCRAPRYLKTVSRAGYRFVAPVTLDAPGATAVAPPASPAASIAVLPFANLSADPDNEYFCDGLSEELINGLTRFLDLRVVAHCSSFSFKGRNTDAREIGRQLDAAFLLEGSVRKTGDQVRISAQLIEAASGYHRWSGQFDRQLDDIFAIQDDIGLAIVDRLRGALLGTHAAPLFRRQTSDMEAYQLYLRGRAFWHKRFNGQLQHAMESFQQAIDRDPGFALAYAGLADAHLTLGIWGFVPPRTAFPAAVALADRALALDDTLAEGHASKAFADLFFGWDWDAARQGLTRALALNPGSAIIRLWYGHYLSIVGDADEAIAEVRRARSLDPFSPIVSANLGWTLLMAHDADRGIDELRRTLEIEPDHGVALFYLGFCCGTAGRYAEAASALERAIDVTGGMPWAAESLGWIHALAGDRRRARAALDASLARMRAGYTPSSAIALIHLGLGDHEEAIEWLERGVEERDALLPWAKFLPCFDPLQADPRFQRLLRRIGLAGR